MKSVYSPLSHYHSQNIGQINARTRNKHSGSSHQGTSTHHSSSVPGHGDYPDEHPEDRNGHDNCHYHHNNDDDSNQPPDPPVPEECVHHREITHDTLIRLKILVDGKDKGDFLHLQTSVKVHFITQNSKSFSTHSSFTQSLTIKSNLTAERANQKLKDTLFT